MLIVTNFYPQIFDTVYLEATGGKAVVAETYAIIFFRNSWLRERCSKRYHGMLTNHTTGKKYKLKAIGDAGPVIDAGGIFAYARKMGKIPSPSY